MIKAIKGKKQGEDSWWIALYNTACLMFFYNFIVGMNVSSSVFQNIFIFTKDLKLVVRENVRPNYLIVARTPTLHVSKKLVIRSNSIHLKTRQNASRRVNGVGKCSRRESATAASKSCNLTHALVFTYYNNFIL